MQSSDYLFPRFLVLFLLSFYFILLSSATAQVKIKEKVEIKPKLNVNIGKGAKNSTASSDYYPCGPWKPSNDLYNPWQVVWYGSSYHLDPGQQAFSYQANLYDFRRLIDSTKTYDFIVTQGKELCHIDEEYIDTVNWTSIPATNAGYELLGISGADMIGELAEGEDPFNLPRIQGVGRRGGFEKYVLYFDEPGNVTFTINEVGSSEVYYFHTIVVRPDYNLTVNLSGTIPYGEEAIVGHNANPIQCQSANWFFWNGGSFDGKYNYEILEGGEYATLEREYFDEDLSEKVRESGQSFEGTEDNVYLYMNGFEPLDSAFVTVKISTTDPEVNTITQVVKVVPNDYYELGVAINPSELNSGDTADVILSRKVAGSDTASSGGYDYEAFPEDQIFNASIVKGTEYAQLYDPVEGTSDYELTDVEQGFKLIINPGVDTNNVEIKLKVSTTISDGTSSPLSAPAGNNHPVKVVNTTVTKHKFKQKVTSSGTNKTAFIGIPSGKEIFGIGKAIVDTSSKIDIMLGETKYFQAKQNNSTHKLKIEEIQPDANGVPQQKTGDAGEGWTWLTENVWGDNPVEIVADSNNSGRKMGVYWEKKYSVKNQWVDFKPNKTKYKVPKMKDLSKGLIRIIARYWAPDSTYKVRLKAMTTTGDTIEMKIKVVKPNNLLSPGQTTSYSYTKDVYNRTLNIDSLCIVLGGKYGIPPQFIKGQMMKESAPHNFGGNIGMGFAPSYRYEPYTVQFWKSIKNNTKYNNYYIPDSSYSFNDVPDHQNVLYYDYFKSIYTVWDIIETYSQLENIANPATYGKRLTSNFMNFYPYTKSSIGIKQKYEKFKNDYTNMYNNILTTTKIADSTNKRMIKYLKEEWKGGTKNIIAQTRAASSYGLLQFLYPTARDRGYPGNNVPENINLITNLYLFINTQKEYLKKGLGKNVEAANNWGKGFEYSIATNIYVPNWNTISNYAQKVFENSQKFLPKK